MNELRLVAQVIKEELRQAVAGVCCRMREGLRAELLGQTLSRQPFLLPCICLHVL